MTLATGKIETAAALSALLPEWRALFSRAPRAVPFQSPDWLIAWWHAFRPGHLSTIAVHDDGALVAIAPLWREDGPLGRRLLPLGVGVSDYLDVLVDPDVAGAGAALVEGVRALEAPWDVWELEDLPEGARALDLPAMEGAEDATDRQNICPVLDLGEGLDSIPAKKRRKWRMARSRAARSHAVEIEHVELGEAVGGFLAHLKRLHEARWRARGEDGLFADPRVHAFHAEALPLLVEEGIARLYLLSFGETIVGAYYGFHLGARAYAYIGGHDPAFAFESPGTILMGHAIAEAVREGAREFHFLRGHETYKFDWGAGERYSYRRSMRRTA